MLAPIIVHPSYFTDEETKAQTGAVTCPDLLSDLVPGPDLRCIGARVRTLLRGSLIQEESTATG